MKMHERAQAKRQIIDTHPSILDLLRAKVMKRLRLRRHPSGLLCWEADGSTNAGYPVVYLPSQYGGYAVQANHIMWRASRGRWHDMLLLHRCDNKLCVRPGHHYEGDDRDNALDRLGRPFAERSRSIFVDLSACSVNTTT